MNLYFNDVKKYVCRDQPIDSFEIHFAKFLDSKNNQSSASMLHKQ